MPRILICLSCIHFFIIKVTHQASKSKDCLESWKGVFWLSAGSRGSIIFLFSPFSPVFQTLQKNCAAHSGKLTAASLLASWSFLFQFRHLELSFESVTNCMSREKGVHWEMALNSLLVPDPESSFTSTESEPANLRLVCLVVGCHVSVCVPWEYLC